MNKRIRKKKTLQIAECYTTRKQREANKELCHRFPFLIPKTGLFRQKLNYIRKPYDYTLKDWFPGGWWEAFGLELCEDLRAELIRCNYLHQFHIEDIKEKYGMLEIYHSGIPIECEADHIIDDYSVISMHVCINCGKPDSWFISKGWVHPCCEGCFQKYHKSTDWITKYEDLISKKAGNLIPDTWEYDKYTSNGKIHFVRDISDKVRRVREKWTRRTE